MSTLIRRPQMSQSILIVRYSTGLVDAERKSGTSFCDGLAVVADCVSSITHCTVVVCLVDVQNYYSILQVSNLVQPAVIAVPLIIFASSSCGLAVLFNLRGTVISKDCLCNYCYSDCSGFIRELTSFQEETSFDSRFHQSG